MDMKEKLQELAEAARKRIEEAEDVYKRQPLQQARINLQKV